MDLDMFFFGWLAGSLFELKIQLFLYFFQMINKENRNSNSSNFEEEYLINQQKKQSERDLRSEAGEWINTIQIDNSNHLLASELQFLAQGSLRTISCRSLDITPEVNLFKPFKENMDGEIYLPKNTSENSIFEEEQNRQTQNQRKMISETRQLILSDQSESSQSEMSTKKSRPLIKNHSRTLSARLHKICKISKIKQLGRNMKKLLSKGMEEVHGNFMLKGDKTDVVVRDGLMTVLMSEKGVIGSLLIRKGEQEIFLKIKNPQCRSEDIKVESWDREEEKWLSFTLRIDLTPK